MFEEIMTAIKEEGFKTVALTAFSLFIVVNYKKIFEWLWATLQASANAAQNEAIISELKSEIISLREQLENHNKKFTKYEATIARLEERILSNAKNKVIKRHKNDDEYEG